jgi:hypothetical protein
MKGGTQIMEKRDSELDCPNKPGTPRYSFADFVPYKITA